MTENRITIVSANLSKSDKLVVNNIDDLLVPAPQPLSCELSYTAVRPTTGKIMSARIGDQELASIRYNDESGLKQVNIDLSQITSGKHEIRIRCIVAHLANEAQSDEALFWLKSGGNTIIKKLYKTHLPIEPFDQIWALSV